MFFVYLISLAHFGTAAVVSGFCFKSKDVALLPVGFVSIFSIGYYVLPVWFLDWSGLIKYNAAEIQNVQLIFLMHYIFLILGCFLAKMYLNVRSFVFDGWFWDFTRSHWFGMILFSGLLFFLYYFVADKTSYSADNFEDFFLERGKLFVTFNALGLYAMALLALLLAITFRRIDFRIWCCVLFFYIFMIFLLAVGGQRLLLLTPLLFLLCSFWILGLKKAVAVGTLISIVLLLAYSPLAVALRGYEGDSQGFVRIVDAVSNYKSGVGEEGGVKSSIRSIVERGDILENSVFLKRNFDASGVVGSDFYYSAIVAFVPKIFFPLKPYPLSDDGTINGEISVKAWRLIMGDTLGSLTAFGGITAYSQGFWVGVILDGILVGVLFVVWQRVLARLGLLGAWVFVMSFPILAVKRVPSSFLEAWVDISGFFVLMAFMGLLGLIYKFRRN